MLLLTILRIKNSVFVPVATYKDKTTGETKPTKAKWVAEVAFVSKEYSKILKDNIVREREQEMDSQVEVPGPGDYLVEVEEKYGKHLINRFISKADLSLLTAKPAAPQASPKKDSKSE